MRKGFARLAFVVVVVVQLAGCGGKARPGMWPLPAGDLAGTRAAAGSSLNARNVRRLRARWRFAFRSPRTASGIFESTPVVDANTVYVEDLRSNVFALDRETGKLEWAHHYRAQGNGPNGLAVDGGRVYGVTNDDVFALAALNGRELWRRRLGRAYAPVPWKNLLVVGTRGATYALDAATGKVRWRFDGGGARYPVSIDADGRLYLGTATSLVVLDAATGRQLAEDRRGGVQATPVLAGGSVFGAGMGARVVAWQTGTQRRLWKRAVCSVSGRIETPPAYADGRLFLPVAGMCAHDPARGRLVALAAATGRVAWQHRLGAPALGCAAVANDVVFTSSSDGTVDGFDARSGALLWRARLPAGVDACPAVAGDTLYVGAGVALRPHERATLVAFSVPR